MSAIGEPPPRSGTDLGHPKEFRATQRVRTTAPAAVLERAEGVAAGLDRNSPYAEQVEVSASGRSVLRDGRLCLHLWRDEAQTAWIVDLDGEGTERFPTDYDLWMRQRAWLRRCIDHVRVVGPLLYKRVVDAGEPGRVDLGDGFLGVDDSAEALRVDIVAPSFCSASEALKVATIAALSVSTTPGWRRVGAASLPVRRYVFELPKGGAT